VVTLVARFFEGILDGVTLCVGGATEAVVADGDDTVVVRLFEPTGVVLGPVPACVAQLARTMAVIVAAKPASIRLMFAPFARLLSARAVTLLEEHHVDDLRPGVTPLGLLFGDEVQREHPGSIDLGLVVQAELPDPTECWLGEAPTLETGLEEVI